MKRFSLYSYLNVRLASSKVLFGTAPKSTFFTAEAVIDTVIGNSANVCWPVRGQVAT